MIYGAIICLIAALRPHGIVGTIVDAIRRGRGSESTVAAGAATPTGTGA